MTVVRNPLALHEFGAREAARLVADPGAVVVLAPEPLAQVVAVRVADGSVLLDEPAGAALLPLLDSALETVGAIRRRDDSIGLVGWDFFHHRDALRRTVSAAALLRYAWLRPSYQWNDVGMLYTAWYCEPLPPDERPDHESGLLRLVRGDPAVKFSARSQSLPGATGDLVTDAHQVIVVLRTLADRTAPVSPLAVF